MNLKKLNLKRIICATMVFALAMTSVTPASAATARATTMKLEKTEGTVTLKTQNGTARKISNGMRLYNGNTIATGKYSYAYVSLDSTKAVKVDQSSSATLRQSGKELELLVKSGKLFFNVSQPLTDKEQMNVRTSTMVTGIRGTCGVVEYVDINKSRLYLIEGQVTLGSGENATTVYGGQTATVVLQPKKENGDSDNPEDSEKPGDTDKPGDMKNPEKEKEQKVLVEKLTEEKIPSVALQEIVNDPVLQEKIEQTTELKIEKIEEAYEQFQKEEAERIEQEKEEQDKDKDTDANKKTADSNDSGSGNIYIPSDSGSSGSSGGSTAIKETKLDGTVTIAMIDEAFKEYQRVHIGENAIMQCSASEILNIPGGKMLHIWGQQEIPATINVGDGNTKGLLCVVMEPAQAALAAGNIHVAANSCLEDHGSLTCNTLTVGANASLINSGELKISDTLQLSNGATYENHGYMSGKDLTSEGGAKIINTDRMMLSGNYKINGTNTDTYEDNNNALLVCADGEPDVLSKKFLLTATVKTQEIAGNITQVYATNLNQHVASYLCERSQAGSLSAEFKRKVIVASDVDFYASGSITLVLNSNQLCITSGTLTLHENIAVNGSNTQAMIILDGGNFKLEGTNADGVSEIRNSDGAVIGQSGYKKGTFIWNDINRVISSGAGSPDNIILGIIQKSDGALDISSAGYCTLKSDYIPELDIHMNQIKLTYLPETFDSDDKDVSASLINRALNYYDVVTIGETATVTLGSGETLIVPSGKTLKIASLKTPVNNARFNMSTNSSILIENNAKLIVSGAIEGDGAIRVGQNDDTATLMVEAGGDIQADSIITSQNSGIQNRGYVFLKNSCCLESADQTVPSSGAYTCSRDSVLISRNSSNAIPSEYLLVCNDSGNFNIYAQCVNEKVVGYMNINAFHWEFQKDAEIDANKDISLACFNISMGANQMIVKGNLTLTCVQTFTGSGTSVIHLSGAGTLMLGKDEEMGTGVRYISSTYTGSDAHYVISVEDEKILSETGRVKWNDKSLQLQSAVAGDQGQYIIQGYYVGDSSSQAVYVTPSPSISGSIACVQ